MATARPPPLTDRTYSSPNAKRKGVGFVAPPGAQGDKVRLALRRIVDSAAFRNSLRLKSFLAFVVDAALAGNAQRIKGYTIAVEALGRDSDFDPQSDPIVRVEAGRLRRALARYYAGPGSSDELIIALPLGSYVPEFRTRDAPAARLPDGSGHRRGLEQSARLSRTLTDFKQLLDGQRVQLAEVAEVIASARKTLRDSRALLGSAKSAGAALDPEGSTPTPQELCASTR